MARVTIGGRTYDVEVRGDIVMVDGHSFHVSVRDDGAYRTVNAGGVQYRVELPPPGERVSGMQVRVDHRPFTLEFEGRLGGGPAPRQARAAAEGPTGAAGPRAAVKGGVAAPIAGKVIRIVAAVGAAVSAGDVLLVVEAMKMENEIKAPVAGTVKEILVAEGARVSEGETLAVIE